MIKNYSLILLTLFLLSGLSVNSQDQEKGIARVLKINGKEVYFLNEPLRDYDVIFDVGTGFKATSIVTGGLVNEGVSEKANQFIQKALKQADGKEFDAVIYNSGKRVVAIRFKGDSDISTKGLARVQKINGLEIYILAEPLIDYEVISSKSGGIKLKSAITGGIVNNSIEEDVNDFVKKILKDDPRVQGVLYSSGKEAAGIRFK